MSYTIYINYGYGFIEDSLIPDIEGVKTLLDMCPVTKQEYAEREYDITTLEGIKAIAEDECYAFGSLYAPFIDAVNELEDIQLTSACDYDDFCYVQFNECMPWQLNDTEKQLTTDKLDAIFRKYLAIYCNMSAEKLAEVRFGYNTVENGG